MPISIGNAPCSWGVEFPDDSRNPPWTRVPDECAAAGYGGIELGPVGFMPEDAPLAEALGARDLTLIGGVIYRPFHDPAQWDDVLDGSVRTCQSLAAHSARELVLIDSISPRRAPTAGRPEEAEQMDRAEWAAFVDRIRTIARMGTQDYGRRVAIHAHAAGFCDSLPELERLPDEIDSAAPKICVDTGHSVYAGFDPLALMKHHRDRIAYVHFNDVSPHVMASVIVDRTDFYAACAKGLFCNLGDGIVDFPAIRDYLERTGFEGWCTIEQDCDPAGETLPLHDQTANRAYLRTIGFS